MNKLARDARLAGMRLHYEVLGRGCRVIGKIYGVNTSTVYMRLKAAGVKFRPRPGVGRPSQPQVEFNGACYTRTSKGYYRRTTLPRTMLHYDVWELYHGPVPDGCEIVHIDRDWDNNDITNLVCLTKEEATRMYNPLHQTPIGRVCATCGEPLQRKLVHGRGGRLFWESPSMVARRQFCNTECHGKFMKGNPRGWNPRRAADQEEAA